MKSSNSGEDNDLTRLLATAMELAGEERDHFLVSLPDNQRSALQRLLILAEDDESESRLQSTIDHLMRSVLTNAPAASQVPRWELLEAIGQGGMAEVFRATRSDGVAQQEAAVKILWPGMMSGAVLARFELEREILAKLTHPNIARMLDGGVADDGRPWMATELVDGVPVDTYCTQQQLALPERLKLFESVASAVAHAHRQLVVHRDIKPANILVDEEGRPRLLDFGIAKRLATEASRTTTGEADRFLTPDYASPEQLEGAQVDTRSDIFQLGLLLYELIWGEHPLIDEAMSNTERQHAIVTARAPRYLRRCLKPGGAGGGLPKEVHAIATKALAPDPDDRYGSVEQLIDDLRNYRTGMPVSARSPGPFYRFYKFINRHRPASALAAVLLAGVIGYAVLVSVQSRRLAEESALNRVVGNFMEALLKQGPMTSGESAGRSVTILLDEAVKRATTELKDQPTAQARVLNLLASIFLVNHGLELTFANVPEAAALAYQSRPMEDHLDAVLTLAFAANFSGAHEESASLLNGALAILPVDNPKTTRARVSLADVLHSLGRYAEATVALEPLLALEPANALVARTAGMIARDWGRYAEAERHLQTAVQLGRAADGENLRDFATTLEHLAQLQLLTGQITAAEDSLDEALKLRTNIRAENTSNHVWTRHWLGTLRFSQGRLTDSEQLLTGTVDDYARLFSTGSQLYGYANSDLGWTLLAQNKLEQAKTAFAQSEKVLRDGQSGVHFRLSEPLLGLGIVAALEGDPALARRRVKRALDIRAELVDSTNPLAQNLCWVYQTLGGECGPSAPPAAGIDGLRSQLITSHCPDPAPYNGTNNGNLNREARPLVKQTHLAEICLRADNKLKDSARMTDAWEGQPN